MDGFDGNTGTADELNRFVDPRRLSGRKAGGAAVVGAKGAGATEDGAGTLGAGTDGVSGMGGDDSMGDGSPESFTTGAPLGLPPVGCSPSTGGPDGFGSCWSDTAIVSCGAESGIELSPTADDA
jgi:hypothetical protein